MRQHRNRFGLIAEAAEKIAVVREFFLQNLYGNPAAFHTVICLIHIGHTANTDQLMNLISAIQTLANESIHKQLPNLSVVIQQKINRCG